MSDKTGIEWTNATWNPIVGCSILSPGCIRCYAMGQAARIERCADGAGQATHYAGTTQASKAGPVWSGKLALAPAHILTAPLRWKRPRRIFVNSMGDLFHEDAPEDWIDRVFAVMALCPQHTFQILTKRAQRMRDYMTRRRDVIAGPMMEIIAQAREISGSLWNMTDWPLPNVWLGVSAEDQKRADERVPDLLATPAAVRFVSAEPLLGPIDLTTLELPGGEFAMDALAPSSDKSVWDEHWSPEATGVALEEAIEGYIDYTGGAYPPSEVPHPKIDWVIVGGESGPGARPMHPDWARSIRDQCAAAGTAFFFKQWGEWSPVEAGGLDGERRDWLILNGQRFLRTGKRRAGRRLDGIEHNAFPEARP